MSGPMAMGFALSNEHRDNMRDLRGKVAAGGALRARDAETILGESGGSVLNAAREMRATPDAFIAQMGESGAIAQDHPLARATAQRGAERAEPRPLGEIMNQAGMTISDQNGGMADRVRWLAFDRAIRKGAPINGEKAVAFLERSMNRAERNGDRDEATAVAGLALEAHESWDIERHAERRARREARVGEAR